MALCFDSNCILGFLKEYPFVISIPVSAFTFYIGWYLHKQKLDVDAANVHFKDLKDHVVNPILAKKYHPGNFPPLYESNMAVNEGIGLNQLPSEVDILLFRDFLDNHYPQIKKSGII
jgi:hypothetical protein